MEYNPFSWHAPVRPPAWAAFGVPSTLKAAVFMLPLPCIGIYALVSARLFSLLVLIVVLALPTFFVYGVHLHWKKVVREANEQKAADA